MRYNVPSGITPLQARLATHYYAYLLIPAFIILVFFVIYLLYQMRKRIRSSPEWLEAQKKRPTVYGDIEKTAKRLSLSKAEASLLWEICRAAKAPNISYLIYNAAEVDKLFGAQYAAMLQSGTAEKKNHVPFSPPPKNRNTGCGGYVDHVDGGHTRTNEAVLFIAAGRTDPMRAEKKHGGKYDAFDSANAVQRRK